jgi:hypothetical protein
MFTACKVYPSPIGTAGKVRVMVPLEGGTLLAMAYALLNAVFISSREKVLGSPASFVQVIVAEPPEERFSGVLRVRAEMRGTTSVKTTNLNNILKWKGETADAKAERRAKSTNKKDREQRVRFLFSSAPVSVEVYK